jgi:hypothetical protein
LLGQYLGDGYLATNGRVPRLRIACATDYPKVADEVDAAMHLVSGNRTSAVVGVGYTDRGSYWMHWPCLLPQDGPGAKHTRPIVLTAWQKAIVTAHPWPLIRGLIHSDGCRAINRVTVRGRRYAYPRYFFSNESHDIIGIFCAALDRVAHGGDAQSPRRPQAIREPVDPAAVQVGSAWVCFGSDRIAVACLEALVVVAEGEGMTATRRSRRPQPPHRAA